MFEQLLNMLGWGRILRVYVVDTVFSVMCMPRGPNVRTQTPDCNGDPRIAVV